MTYEELANKLIGPRENPTLNVRKCRGHWHIGDDTYGSYGDSNTAEVVALWEWATDSSYDTLELLEQLAVAEEDRFNESGTYRPNDIPDRLRQLAKDLIRYRALAASPTVHRYPAE